MPADRVALDKLFHLVTANWKVVVYQLLEANRPNRGVCCTHSYRIFGARSVCKPVFFLSVLLPSADECWCCASVVLRAHVEVVQVPRRSKKGNVYRQRKMWVSIL